jgi:hypothetical protein
MTIETDRHAVQTGRRRVLGLLAGLGTLGLLLPRLAPWTRAPDSARTRARARAVRAELSVHEAEFYRSHDLAG